jgi:methanogenic corrinoid protein MtbC1
MNTDSRLAELVADLEEEQVLEIVRQRVETDGDLFEIINECNQGMREVGSRYESGDYFIAGLIMAGEIFSQVVKIVQPLLEEQFSGQSSGKILIGTVAGDIHDLGKNMFGMLLSSHGFDVVDLGVDVAPEVFTAKVLKHRPDIIGLSGLITASFKTMKDTITCIREEFKNQDLSIPILIGGGFIDEQIHQFVDSDHWVNDAMEGVRLCEEILDRR